jgi:hypothetical protein
MWNIIPRITNQIELLELRLAEALEAIKLINHDLKARKYGETVKNQGEEGGAGNNNSIKIEVSGREEGTGPVSGELDVRHQEYGEVSYTSQTKKG